MRRNDDEKKDALVEEIRELRAEIKGLRKERDVEQSANERLDEINRLKRQISDLKIEKSKLDEDHAREKREVEHMVGLQKRRGEFETKAAKREAVLSVREENLTAEKDRLADQVAFLEKRFEAEVGYLKEIMTEVLGRLPDVTVRSALPASRPARKAS